MVTGSVVSSLQGEPRSTHDIDMVIMLKKEAVKPLSQAFPTDLFYIKEGSVLDAVDRKSMFNLIDGSSGNEVDFWLLTDEPFDKVRFARRQRTSALDLANFYITTPEDTILSKLRWAKLAGGSEKQLTDAIRVFEMQFDRLDLEYIKHWINTLELHTQWQYLIDQAEPY
jgi:hypothetical protein